MASFFIIICNYAFTENLANFVLRQSVHVSEQYNGLQKYKKALEIFRNFGSNSNTGVALIIYYGLFAFVADSKLFDGDNLAELKKLTDYIVRHFTRAFNF